MSREEVFQKIEEIFRDLLDDPDFILREDLSQDTFEEWDSLLHTTLIALLEDELQVTFDTDDIVQAHEVKTFLDVVMQELERR